MGGIGSGREADVYSGTVEESLQLDVNKLKRDGAIKAHIQANGILTWNRPIGEKPSIGYEIHTYGQNGHIRLIYSVSSLGMDEKAINYNIELYTTRPHFGGLRWWFICPNQDCNRMLVKLYQPPGAEYFLCRTCHNLTYQSCRDSGKFNSIYEVITKDTGLDVKQVKRMFKRLNY